MLTSGYNVSLKASTPTNCDFLLKIKPVKIPA